MFGQVCDGCVFCGSCRCCYQSNKSALLTVTGLSCVYFSLGFLLTPTPNRCAKNCGSRNKKRFTWIWLWEFPNPHCHLKTTTSPDGAKLQLENEENLTEQNTLLLLAPERDNKAKIVNVRWVVVETWVEKVILQGGFEMTSVLQFLFPPYLTKPRLNVKVFLFHYLSEKLQTSEYQMRWLLIRVNQSFVGCILFRYRMDKRQ